jgi:hypothetical protein
MGAISRSQSSWPVSTELRDAIDFNPMDMRPVSPYDKRNKTMLSYATGLKNLEVPEQLTLDEAAGVFEIWKGQGVFGRSATHSLDHSALIPAHNDGFQINSSTTRRSLGNTLNQEETQGTLFVMALLERWMHRAHRCPVDWTAVSSDPHNYNILSYRSILDDKSSCAVCLAIQSVWRVFQEIQQH